MGPLERAIAGRLDVTYAVQQTTVLPDTDSRTSPSGLLRRRCSRRTRHRAGASTTGRPTKRTPAGLARAACSKSSGARGLDTEQEPPR